MAPVEVEINIRNRPPDKLQTVGEKPLVVTVYPPAPIEVRSINGDRTGELRVTGRTSAISVKKHTSERDKVGTEVNLDSSVTFSDQEFVVISSTFYDETLRVSHRSQNYSFYGRPDPRVRA